MKITVEEAGRKGGINRRNNMTPEARKASAKKAADARWKAYRANKKK
jgi:hypothetical protein